MGRVFCKGTVTWSDGTVAEDVKVSHSCPLGTCESIGTSPGQSIGTQNDGTYVLDFYVNGGGWHKISAHTDPNVKPVKRSISQDVQATIYYTLNFEIPK